MIAKWYFMQYFNQILTAILEVLDDSDSSIRELALSLIVEMLKNQVCCIATCGPFMLCTSSLATKYYSPNCFLHHHSYFLSVRPNTLCFSLCFFFSCLYFQKGSMEDSVEIVIEKLLHVAKDTVPKVTSIY